MRLNPCFHRASFDGPGTIFFVPDVFVEAALDNASRLGLTGPLRSLRVTAQTGVFQIDDLVIRVALPHRTALDAAGLVAHARLLHEYGLPVVQPVGEPLPDPVFEVTCWHYVPNDPQEPIPGRQLGQLLTRLHEVPVPLVSLPSLSSVVPQILERFKPVAATGVYSASLVEDVDRLLHKLGRRVQAVVAESTPVVLHGDVNDSNVLRGVLPGLVLCDLEFSCLGPWAWDFSRLYAASCFGDAPSDLFVQMIEGAGVDPRTCPGWSTLWQWKALSTATWFLNEGVDKPDFRDQGVTRVLWSLEQFSKNG